MGREFLEIFEQWADSYDDTVGGHDLEYQEVFAKYEQILEAVVARSCGHVVEFGAGTGNLTQKLLANGFKVTGIEPSPAMRKIAEAKLGEGAVLLEGDFLQFPEINNIHTFVSSYAFHHLTNDEKEKAVAYYSKQLSKDGRIVFADTMFESMETYNKQIVKAKNQGFHNLAKDLETEYYSTIPFLSSILEKNSFSVTFTRFNDFVWLMEGIKQ